MEKVTTMDLSSLSSKSDDLVFYLDPTEIKVKEELPRIRKDMRKIEDLLSSMEKFGQMLPVLINRNFELIAGGRRLAACTLGGRKVKCIFSDTIDSLTMREMELEENLQRENLTPAEEVLAVEEIHNLKQSIHGVAVQGREDSGWTLEDTARLIGKAASSVHGDIELARAIKDYPGLANMKTKSDIKKALKGINKLSQRIDAIAKHEQIISGSKIPIDIKCMDAKEHMKSIPNGAVDIVLTDPPWGIDIDKLSITIGGVTGGEHTTSGFKYEDNIKYAMDLYSILANESFRFTSPKAHLYTFVGTEYYFLVSTLFQTAGWLVRPKPIIWIKGPSGQNNAPHAWPTSAYESILYARKDESRLILEGKVDWIQCQVVNPDDRLHEAEKPLFLLKELLLRVGLPGQTVYDPFCGSGATVEAALEMMMLPIACDILQESYASTLKRVADWEKAQGGK